MKTLMLHSPDAVDRSICAPFALLVRFESQTRELICQEILRVLPGRRLVARVTWENADAVLKLFVGPGAQRYCEREARGLQRLSAAGVSTPEVLARVSAGGSATGLVIRYLPDSHPVDMNDVEAFADVVRLFAQLHTSGVWQADLHLDNFLFSGQTLYAVDGDGVKNQSGALDVGRSLANLGLLLAERPPSQDPCVERWAAVYCEARGWRLERHRGAVSRALTRQRQNRVRRFSGKTTRDCTQFAVTRHWGAFTARLRDWQPRDWPAFVDNPDRVVDDPDLCEVLKAGNSATVVRWRPDNGPCVVVKRYNVKSLLHGVRRGLGSTTRFRRAWRNGHTLEFLAIPTATPLGLVEQRRGPWRGVGYLVMQDLGSEDLAVHVARRGLSDQLCDEVVDLFVLLARSGFSHGDTKASNFLYHEGHVHLIDLDGMRRDAGGMARDVARFLRNWDGAERARFEAAFAAASLV